MLSGISITLAGRVVPLLVVLGSLAAPAIMRAQVTPETHPELFALVQDTIYVLRIGPNGDTTDANKISGAYEYTMVNDSSSYTKYLVTEIKNNGALVKLLHWVENRTVHADARLLTYNSRTVNFKVRAGDTLTFYRELMWYNPITREQLLNNYYSTDTLDFSVDLVRVSNGEPIALLDSIGMLPRVPVGSPRIYGTRPPFARVKYIVPPGLNDSVFVGVTVQTRGKGAYHFVRTDRVTIGFSDKVDIPHYKTLNTMYGSVMTKRPIQDLQRAEKPGGSLSVSAQRDAPNDLLISFTAPDDGEHTAIAIYDAHGALVAFPYFGVAAGASSTSCRLEHRGAYFITLIHGGAILQTHKTIINQ